MSWLFWIFIGTIFYTYIGYPVILCLLAIIRRRTYQHTSSLPSVTLLISAYNEQSVLAQKLENSLALNYPRDRLQILIAADGSDDHTTDIVKMYADQGVELSYEPQRRGKMAAINRALPRARGEIVVFSDANNFYDVDALGELVAPFGDSTVGAVCGAKLIARGDRRLGESEGLYWKYESFIKRQETRVGCCTAVAGEIFAIRRNLFESPPSHIINDDFYMAMRLIQRGYCVVYAPKARSYERVSLSAQDEIARRARIVAGRFQAMGMARKILTLCTPLIVWQIVSHKFLRPLVPLFMIGALVTNVLCVVMPPSGAERSYVQLTAPINWILLILQTLFYASAVIGNHFQCSGDLGRLLYLPTFLFNSNLAALAGLYRFLARHQTTLWQRVQRRDSQSEDAMRWLSGLPHSQIEK